jgi:hypothetical protein
MVLAGYLNNNDIHQMNQTAQNAVVQHTEFGRERSGSMSIITSGLTDEYHETYYLGVFLFLKHTKIDGVLTANI